VTGAIQPIAEIGRAVRGAKTQALVLVDAAQSLGHVAIDVSQVEVDLVAPLGTGVLYVRKGVEDKLRPLRFGGTGTQSNEDRQPDDMPEKFESGNHNMAGLAGLAAAVQFLRDETIESIHEHHTRLAARLLEGLGNIDGVTIHGPRSADHRTSVISLSIDGYEPQELAAILEASHGIQCRAGLHCAPRMHAALGTKARGGTLRLSPGYSTTHDQIDTVINALQDIAAVTI
jgi:selenocysteine lyase/cysteine desulfurase